MKGDFTIIQNLARFYVYDISRYVVSQKTPLTGHFLKMDYMIALISVNIGLTQIASHF